uniref:Putative secreted peptide n=1 Tax=Anopheles braziliensis TaxID=58242 RepID=A0A2M3ZX52_9DIPT
MKCSNNIITMVLMLINNVAGWDSGVTGFVSCFLPRISQASASVVLSQLSRPLKPEHERCIVLKHNMPWRYQRQQQAVR